MYDISICMPYYERSEVLCATLRSFIRNGYFENKNISVQVVIVDDGSVIEAIPKEMTSEFPWLKVVYLPRKREWKCPTLPMNTAVKNADSEIIVLQSPETIHEKPVISPLIKHTIKYKDVICVPTKVTGDRTTQWYSHPKYRKNTMWFCQSMHKKFFMDVGGFDESFRDLYAGEDNDFAIRLLKSGASFKWLDPNIYYVLNHRTAKVGIDNDRGLRHKKAMELLKKRYGKRHSQLIKGDYPIIG